MQLSYDLYSEIVDFMASCGGTYEHLDGSTCIHLLDAMSHDRLLIFRSEDGKLQRVMVYWLIHPEDVDTVKHGGIPDDVNSGTVIYIAEHAGNDGRKGLLSAMRHIRQTVANIKGACWHDRWSQEGLFRYFSGQKSEVII